MLRSALWGALFAMLSVFPVAVLVTLCFRFPIPFVGLVSGLEAISLRGLEAIFFAVVFFGLPGGFVLIAGLGCLAGFLAQRFADTSMARRWLALGFAIGFDFVVIMILAVLDKIIGPW
jgi:hypothetical protein